MTDQFVHVVLLPLEDGKVIIIDASDYATVCGYEWYLSNKGYAVAGGGTTKVSMHRLILGLEGSQPHVDHINGVPFDNRRCNLRICTHAENLRNTKKQKDCTSIYKGVHKDANENWVAAITFNGKKRYLDRFDHEDDAAKAYDEAACELFGEFAKLNFPHLRPVYEQHVAERAKNPVPRRDRRRDRKRAYRPPTPAPQTPVLP